jgi:hypothetical protein
MPLSMHLSPALSLLPVRVPPEGERALLLSAGSPWPVRVPRPRTVGSSHTDGARNHVFHPLQGRRLHTSAECVLSPPPGSSR